MGCGVSGDLVDQCWAQCVWQRRCKGDAKEMQRRCKGDAKEMQRRCKEDAKKMPAVFIHDTLFNAIVPCARGTFNQSDKNASGIPRIPHLTLSYGKRVRLTSIGESRRVFALRCRL